MNLYYCVPLSFETLFSKKNEMISNKICCAALPKKTKLNHVAAISQLTSRVHRHLTGLCANLRAGDHWPVSQTLRAVLSSIGN